MIHDTLQKSSLKSHQQGDCTMLITKILIAMCAIFLIILITKTCSNGMQCKMSRSKRSKNYHISGHKMYSSMFLLLMIATILLIKMSTFTGILPKPDTQTLLTHVISSGIFLTLFLSIKFHFTGIRYPKLHKFLAYSCLVSFLFALTSGTIMLWHL